MRIPVTCGAPGRAIRSEVVSAGREVAKIYIAWKHECFRGLQSAHVFGLDLELIYPFRGRGALGTLVRYALSAFCTIALLVRRRPATVAVLNQPAPLAL